MREEGGGRHGDGERDSLAHDCPHLQTRGQLASARNRFSLRASCSFSRDISSAKHALSKALSDAAETLPVHAQGAHARVRVKRLTPLKQQNGRRRFSLISRPIDARMRTGMENSFNGNP